MAQTNILLEAGTNELEIVEFFVNHNGYEAHYGVNVAKVIEIGRCPSVTAMPNAPQSAFGGVLTPQWTNCAIDRYGPIFG